MTLLPLLLLGVTLAWDPGLPLTPTDRYVVSRNGVEVAQTPALTVTDPLPGPGTYTYTVQAVAGAERSAASAPLTLTAAALTCTLVQTPQQLSVTCPLAPPPPAGPYPLRPVGTVRVQAVDSEELVGENGAARNALDGLMTTKWHTQWKLTPAPLPHTLTLDLGAVLSVDGLAYQPRLDGSLNGTITGYRVEVSQDLTAWTPATSGTWAPDAATKVTRFAATPARYVRLVALASANGGPWTAAAEVGVYAVEGTP